MKKRILSIISGLILISLFAVSCSDKKGTDPTNTPSTPNKGIQTYQGNWKVDGQDVNQTPISGTINIASDGTITGNIQGLIDPSMPITKDKITDKGNEVYEINMSEYSMIYEFTFSNSDSGTWKVFVSLNGNKQENASGSLTRQ